VAAVVPDAMCDRPSRQEHAEQATDGFHHEHPLVPDWLGAATTDPARIEAWWCQHPRANIGLLTGVVFDVLDVPSELVEDQAVLATLPEGPVARTGAGRHHYFVAPSGRGNVVIRPVPATPQARTLLSVSGPPRPETGSVGRHGETRC
jgi:Bifunctional DNA primase/polymerase, N-terminal